MLTRNDLQAIKTLVKDEIDTSLVRELKPIKDDIHVLAKSVNILGVNVSSMGKDVKVMQKDLRKVKKDTSVMLDVLNRDDMKLLKRVKRIEEHE